MINSLAFFRAGQELTIKFEPTDSNGSPITVVSAEFNLYDVAEELMIGGEAASIGQTIDAVIPATHNMIVDDEVRTVRSVEMIMTDNQSVEHKITQRYFLEADSLLVVGLNSLCKYSQALRHVPELPEIEAFCFADERSQIAAMVEAYHRISRLKLDGVKFSSVRDYDKATWEDDNEITQEMRQAFTKAQIIEASNILGANPRIKAREDGVMSHSAGESTTFFRTGKPVSYAISKRALLYIGRYVSFSVQLARG